MNTIPINSKVLSPSGWLDSGTLTIGEQIITAKGNLATIIGVRSVGVFDTHRLKLKDDRNLYGTKKTIVCFKHSSFKHKYIDTPIETLNKYDLTNSGHLNLITPYDGPDADLNINPYLLGILLGDGTFCSTSDGVKFSKNDIEFFENIWDSILPEEVYARRGKYNPNTCNFWHLQSKNFGKRNRLREFLAIDGILGCDTWNKYVPWKYMSASFGQRMRLIQGLIDTDGFTSTRNEIRFGVASKKLAVNFQELIQSTGGIAILRARDQIDDVTKSIIYEVSVRVKNPSAHVTMPRKKDRLTESTQYSERLGIKILSIENVDPMEHVSISLFGNDKTFVTDGYVYNNGN